jgi:hypothetical protein
MTDKNQSESGKQQAVELQDETLDDVSGGPVYVKIDSIVDGTSNIKDGTSNILDGTSNIKDGMSHIVR